MRMKELMVDPAELCAIAPAGFYLAIRIGFAFPMVELNHLPASWVREYTAGGLMVHDPAMSWAYKNSGTARWSDLVASDSLGVLDLAKDHGLEYGAVVSCTDRNDASQRSFGLFCRSDREYDVENSRGSAIASASTIACMRVLLTSQALSSRRSVW